ncbi:MAG: hypothetical protein ACK5II_02615 [Paracoccus sp. (in: a-proteobacteria)]
MGEVSIIRLDLVMNVLQMHGAGAMGQAFACAASAVRGGEERNEASRVPDVQDAQSACAVANAGDLGAAQGHLAEYGLIAPQGPAHLARLKDVLEQSGSELPKSVIEIGMELLSHIQALEVRINGLSARLRSSEKA